MTTIRSAWSSSLIVLIILLSVPRTAGAQRVYPLREAIDRALAATEDVKIARLRVEQAEHMVAVAKAKRLPSLSLSAGYTWISETAGIDFQIPGLLSRRISFGDGNVYDAGITAAVPLFTGFRLSRLEEAQRHGGTAAKEALRARRIETANAVTNLYRKAQLARMAVQLYNQQLAALGAHQNMVANLLEQGQALSYDTLVISTRMMGIEVARATSESEYRNTLLTLSVLVQPGEAFDVEEQVVYDELLAQSGHASLLAEALEQRPDMRQLASHIAMQRGFADAERSSLYPSIGAVASLRYGKPGVDQVANEWMAYYTAGISLQWSLWSWGTDIHNIEAREIDTRSSELRHTQLRRKIEADISSMLNDIDVLKQNMALLDQQIAREKEKFALISVRVREGLANTVELVDAETALTEASLARQKASILYAMKVNEIAVSIGREF